MFWHRSCLLREDWTVSVSGVSCWGWLWIYSLLMPLVEFVSIMTTCFCPHPCPCFLWAVLTHTHTHTSTHTHHIQISPAAPEVWVQDSAEIRQDCKPILSGWAVEHSRDKGAVESGQSILGLEKGWYDLPSRPESGLSSVLGPVSGSSLCREQSPLIFRLVLI